MENKQIVKEYIELVNKLKNNEVIVICNECKETKYSKSFDALILGQCDDCYNKMMEGITIPTF